MFTSFCNKKKDSTMFRKFWKILLTVPGAFCSAKNSSEILRRLLWLSLDFSSGFPFDCCLCCCSCIYAMLLRRFERVPNGFPHTHWLGETQGKIGGASAENDGTWGWECHPSGSAFLFLIWAVVREMQLAIVYTKGQMQTMEAKANQTHHLASGKAWQQTYARAHRS